ncbi:MAG: aminopeptidase, partial [Chloroflexota bacterium]
MDPRVAKLSDIVVNYSVAVRPDDWVVIQTTTFGEPLARACAAAVLKAGGYPSVFLSSEEIGEDLFNAGNDKQLQYISPAALMISEKSDVHIAIIAPGNTHSLAGIDPSRMAVLARGREPLMDTMMRRTQDGSFRWNVCAYPTPAGAQDAHMSLDSYSDFIFDAALLKEPDPVHAWKNLGERQQKLIDWLSDKSEVHIVGPDTDLKVG